VKETGALRYVMKFSEGDFACDLNAKHAWIAWTKAYCAKCAGQACGAFHSVSSP
jgi:hypothetical protein